MKPNSMMRIAGALTAGVGALSAYLFVVRPWHLRWGATDEELGEALPGDELVPNAELIATHSITIDAPVGDVWPWLVQIGQTRGGFYSYTSLENLVGCHMRNAIEINPQWQTLNVGDPVWLHPKAPPLPVAIVEPFLALVLGGQAEAGKQSGTWGFYLKEIDSETTRLIIRARWERNEGLLNWLGEYFVLEPAHFIMERKMMLGIKQRAESLKRQQAISEHPSPAAKAVAG